MIQVLENLLPKSNQLQIPGTNNTTPIHSEIVDGVLHVWEHSGDFYKPIPDAKVDLDPSKTYCLGFFGEVISGRYALFGISGYKNIISSNGAYYITASGATKSGTIHLRASSSGGEIYIKSFFLVEGDRPPSIWTPAHADLTPEQIALMKYGEYKEIKSF